MANLPNYNFGGEGVNLVKGPLHLSDGEATQLQNAELVPDQSKGGEGVLSKRGGLAALTSALAGSVLGMISLPLQTTYVRTLYAALGDADSDTWIRTTNGTSWTSTSALARGSLRSKDIMANNTGNAQAVAFKTAFYYPGNDYTQDRTTPANNTALPINKWNGSESVEVMRFSPGPSGDGNYPFSILDMLQANGRIYFAVWDPPNSGAPNLRGRVLEFNPSTNIVKQIAEAFGPGTNEIAGGVPCCMVWHQGQLFVGLDNNGAANDVCKIVRCFPDRDTAWTTDISTLKTSPKSMAVYNGDLYVGLVGAAAYVARVVKRSQATGLYADSDTQATSGDHYYGALIVYGTDLYAYVYSDGGADFAYIRKFDGTSWTTDRDVTANDSGGVAMDVGSAIVYGSDLYYSIRATDDNDADGFILRKSGGSWTKVVTDNINGKLVVLLERS